MTVSRSSAAEVTSEFDLVTRRVVTETAGRVRVDLAGGWTVGAAVNGGILMSVLAAAMQDACRMHGHPDPLVISAFFLSAATGAARGTASGTASGTAGGSAGEVETEVIRVGRSMSTATASLTQLEGDGERRERVRATATFGDLARLLGHTSSTAVPLDLPPVEDCLSVPLSADRPELLERLDLRFDPGYVGWALGEPAGQAVMQAWFRLADGREPDPLVLLLALDALPPVTFGLGIPGWAPTLELTAHVRARPAPGWLQVRISSTHLAGGLLEEDAEVWDSQGTLVAMSRQLARAPAPQR